MKKVHVTFGDNEIEKCKFHYSKQTIKINNEDINKISNKVSLVKKVLKTLLVIKIIKKLIHYVYCFQK